MLLAKAETGSAEEQPARKYTRCATRYNVEKEVRAKVLAFLFWFILQSTQCPKKTENPGGNKKKQPKAGL